MGDGGRNLVKLRLSLVEDWLGWVSRRARPDWFGLAGFTKGMTGQDKAGHGVGND
jgi:hypothetical protein